MVASRWLTLLMSPCGGFSYFMLGSLIMHVELLNTIENILVGMLILWLELKSMMSLFSWAGAKYSSIKSNTSRIFCQLPMNIWQKIANEGSLLKHTSE